MTTSENVHKPSPPCGVVSVTRIDGLGFNPRHCAYDLDFTDVCTTGNYDTKEIMTMMTRQQMKTLLVLVEIINIIKLTLAKILKIIIIKGNR